MPELFAVTAGKYPDAPALCAKEGGVYKTTTYATAQKKIHAFARGLFRLGLKFGERLAILLPNSPDWVITDMATLSLGCVDVPLYTSLSATQMKQILVDSGAKAIVLSGSGQFAKIQEIISDLPEMRVVITLEHPRADLPNVNTLSFDSVIRLGGEMRASEEKDFSQTLKHTKKEDTASIIYTSGTTGEPRGVVLTHNNFLSNVGAILRAIKVSPADRHLSFLPLSHAFERTAGYYCFIASGMAIYYAENMETITQNMLEVRPTVGVSVPRLFEKMQARIKDKISSSPALRQKLFGWALDVGARVLEGRMPLTLRIQLAIANLLVHKKIAAAFGGKLRFFASGGAPLNKDTAIFLASLGIKIVEGYGLTETSPVISFNRLEDSRVGTVGKLLDNVKLKIASDGEILVKGPNVMKGYFNNPQASADVMDAEGWFHTGDIGVLSDDGFLSITDRKKEIVVLSSGKNVAPQPLELKLQSDEYVATAMVIGDKRNFVSALIVPDFEKLKKIAKQLGIKADDNEKLVKEPLVITLIEGKTRKLMEAFSRFEQVKKITLLPREFSQEHGELTPTLKLKRRVILENFADEISAIYRS